MSDTRTYIVPDGQENSTNQMLPWMAMMNGGMGGFGNGMWNNPFMYLVWMWMMRWMNNGEWGNGNNCQSICVNIYKTTVGISTRLCVHMQFP